MSDRLVDLLFSSTMLLKLLFTVLVLILLVLLRKLVLRWIWQHFADTHLRYTWRKTVTYVIVACALLITAGTWLEGGTSLATYLGLLSAGLAVALSEPLSNLVGWLFVVWRKPFAFGDRIQVGAYAGDVIDIRLFQFTLLEIGNWVDADQSTGRVVHVPNRWVFKDPLFNYTDGFAFIWNEIAVTVTFESHWQKAKDLLQRVADEHVGAVSVAAAEALNKSDRRLMIGYTALTPAIYTRVVDYGVRLTLRYLCPPRRRRGTAQELWEAVLRTFAEHEDVAFAYPTQRFFNRDVEGRSGPYPTVPMGEVVIRE